MRRILSIIKYKIGTWLYYNSPIYIGTLNIFKPLKTWFSARKHFKKPHITFRCGKIDNIATGSIYNDYFSGRPNFIMFFDAIDVEWKYKNEDISFESEPTIVLSLFNTWKFIWIFEAPTFENKYRNNNGYWEAVIDYVFNGKDIIKTKQEYSWMSSVKDENGIPVKNGEDYVWINNWDDEWLTEHGKKITQHIIKNDKLNN